MLRPMWFVADIVVPPAELVLLVVDVCQTSV